jgi:hypothetical protein
VIGQLVTRFASRLRFPALFALVASLFVVDLLVPDLVPFFDEVMLALGTLLLGMLRKRRPESDATVPQDALKSDT